MLVRVPFTVEESCAGWRLDRYLHHKIRRLSRSRIQKLIETRLEHDGARPLKSASRVAAGQRFALLKEAEPEPETPLDFGLVHDDGALLVVDKPAGLPIHPTARYLLHTFTALARARFPGRKVDPAHRLDRETSGLLCCGGAPVHTAALKRSFAAGRVEKTYLAICEGRSPAARFLVDARLRLSGASRVRVRMHVERDGLAARTEFEVLERRLAPDGAPLCLLACRPRTGRQHQIRAHLSHAGLPLLGDKIYGPDEEIFDRFTRKAMTEDDLRQLRLPRQALHAWKLSFPHPVGRQPVSFEAPLAADLAAFWESCAPAAGSR